MNLLWRKANVGVAVALCAATLSSAQDAPESHVMSRQVQSIFEQGEYDGDWTSSLAGQPVNDVEPAAWLQQPARQPSLATTQPSARAAATAQRLARSGLVSAPNMFGDLAGPTVAFRFIDINTAGGQVSSTGIVNLPAAGGGSRIGKIAENDSPIPRDRVFFTYNHFQNVFQLNETPIFPPGPTLIRQEPLDRYTIGAEKTFFDQWMSVEIRMPFLGTPDTQLPSIGINTGNVGNLTAIFKSLLYMDDATAVGAGVAVETPTGSDLFTRIGNTNLRFLNQGTHILPYIGFVWSPGDPQWGWGDAWFVTGFAQIDINASSNPVNVLGANGVPTTTLGQLTDQNLGFLDLAVGYWLFRNPYAERLTGVAAITELHYTTALQDADRIAGGVNGTAFILNATGNRFDVLNGTVGVQFLLYDMSSLRVAGVFPIGNEDRRFFDSEVQVQFNRRF
jgi:hypothetical protein